MALVSERAEAAPDDVSAALAPMRKKHDLPALAVLVLKDGKTVGQAVVGVRKYGTDVTATIGDQFHLGSCTKAMTATMLARLVEQSKLAWDLTLAKAFPELADKMPTKRRDVTLEMLLAHRAGFANRSVPKGSLTNRLPGTPREARKAYVELFLKEAPDRPEEEPGTRFEYTNTGYSVAAVMAEQVMDSPWESLMEQLLFTPLNMKSAGFGAMGTPGKLDQPLQHVLNGGKHISVEPGPNSDNPPTIGPAGTVHCTLADWGKFIALHMAGERGKEGLLKADTIRQLHKPNFGGDYTFGWIVTDRPWGGGHVYTHAGSNTQNYAVVWMAPKVDFAVLIATNQGGDAAAAACDEAAGAMITRYLS